jgi:hypothetical protein
MFTPPSGTKRDQSCESRASPRRSPMLSEEKGGQSPMTPKKKWRSCDQFTRASQPGRNIPDRLRFTITPTQRDLFSKKPLHLSPETTSRRTIVHNSAQPSSFFRTPYPPQRLRPTAIPRNQDLFRKSPHLPPETDQRCTIAHNPAPPHPIRLGPFPPCHPHLRQPRPPQPRPSMKSATPQPR